MNWFQSTGSLQFQGKPEAREKLEREALSLLYPKEFSSELPHSALMVEPAIESADIHIGQEHSLPIQYLLNGLRNSEIVIGIVSAVGTKSKRVVDLLVDRLGIFGYVAEEIRVSKILPECPSGGGEYKRIRHYMEAGDALRQKSSNNAILAAGVAKSISSKRDLSKAVEKRAFIVNSLKHPDEVAFLRKVYGDGFYLFGLHADEKRRHRYLTEDKGCSQAEAGDLIRIDENENFDYGQKTRDTYHLSDLFLSLGRNEDHVEKTIQRFLDLIFSDPYKNPTFDEFGMFMAFNSAVRSSDLSRQVGAVISKNRQIIATGANDVPQSGGGLYWAEVDPETGEVTDQPGGKDYTREEDSNKRAQIEIIDEITSSALKGQLVSIEQEERFKEILRKSKISDLTEFGRVVHAEMEALLSCTRAGIPTADAILYCTTFPCHNCAKHIIAAGIKRVVYVEPYPKSKALEFHSESIHLKTHLDGKVDESLVVFEPFVGVGPRRFLDLFSMNLGSGSKLKRKGSQGTTLSWSRVDAVIRTPLLPCSYLDVEAAAIDVWERENR
ncbi:anti-phage dCTP deaminase [Massilia sp. YIM B02769]|uniref:anti-phage dCTP deaminase n=1 Tax=Massilia sp. YIM B02769 TaxID=3050129 RepID=UPI0025B6FFC9|nr:anti-phage dCTP deaminase [Massilia sp. YIM B02769]MDN4060286.1 anti-phage dCTP deaminase [Massilia sp. YIM B02769]